MDCCNKQAGLSTISLQIDIEEAGHDTAVAADEQENDDGNS